MKSPQQIIKEELTPFMDKWLDKISDWCDGRVKDQFAVRNLKRAGWQSSIPCGDHKCAALVWNGHDRSYNDVLLMVMPYEETENSAVFNLICAKDADPNFLNFKTVGEHAFILHLNNWKEELLKELNWFWLNEFKKD